MSKKQAAKLAKQQAKPEVASTSSKTAHATPSNGSGHRPTLIAAAVLVVSLLLGVAFVRWPGLTPSWPGSGRGRAANTQRQPAPPPQPAAWQHHQEYEQQYQRQQNGSGVGADAPQRQPAPPQQHQDELQQQRQHEYEQKYREWEQQWEQWHEWQRQQRELQEQELQQLAAEQEIWANRLAHELKRDKEVRVRCGCLLSMLKQ